MLSNATQATLRSALPRHRDLPRGRRGTAKDQRPVACLRQFARRFVAAACGNRPFDTQHRFDGRTEAGLPAIDVAWIETAVRGLDQVDKACGVICCALSRLIPTPWHGPAIDPDFLSRRQETARCAAFIEESRMKRGNASSFTGNPGDPDAAIFCLPLQLPPCGSILHPTL